MTEFGEALRAPEAATANADMASEPEQTRLVGQLRILDPTLPFGEGIKSVVANVGIYEQPNGDIAVQTEEVDWAISKGVAALHNNSEDAPGSLGAQTDMLNPLALTEHEAAVVASWEVRDGAAQADHEEAAVEPDEDTGFMGTPLGKLVMGTATGLAGLGGGLAVATPALAQPNQIPAPAAKISSPFELSSSSPIELDSSATSLTPAEEQQCVDIAVSGLVKDPRNGLTMHYAGIRPNTPGFPRDNYEFVNGYYVFQTMPDGSDPSEPDCSGIVRAAQWRLQMQSQKHRSEFWYLGKQPAEPVIPTRSGESRVGVVWGGDGSDAIFNHCPDGKHWLKVRDEETLIARDAQTHKILGAHTYDWPVRIQGSCKAAARSARLVNGFGVRK